MAMPDHTNFPEGPGAPGNQPGHSGQVACRHCLKPLTEALVDLGSAPPSNAYLSADALWGPETWLPLNVLYCDKCWLVQTRDFAARELLFDDDYAYFSSMSAGWVKHAREYADTMTERFSLTAQSMVVEVASNDGYLLRNFAEAGVPCLGVEPTAAVAAAARNVGVSTKEMFFGAQTATRLKAEHYSADLMAANNVLAHVPDINDFVRGFEILLKPEGIVTFEFPHVLNMIRDCQFDTIYHEHFSYLSLLAVERILIQAGMKAFDAQELPTHGGSLRVYAQKANGIRPECNGLQKVRSDEANAGLNTNSFYLGFQTRAEQIKDAFLTFLIEARRDGKTVAAYGAAAKGNTFLNFAGVRPDLIGFVVDRSPGKQGRYMPGSRIPIVAEDQISHQKPDYIVILPWNLRTEISEQLSYSREWGAQFVTAIPELEVF